MLYLPVMLVSIAAMVPFVIIAERRGRMKPVFLGAVAAAPGWPSSRSAGAQRQFLGLRMRRWWLFFTAFNLLEATLPSLVSKVAPVDAKGTAMGVYSTSQFAGAFCGGLIGGWMHQQFGIQAVFAAGTLAALLWLLFASGMTKPGALFQPSGAYRRSARRERDGPGRAPAQGAGRGRGRGGGRRGRRLSEGRP